ncbi:MAG: sulfotransferase [Myxococcota bacterium]|nr:sulfotransferase [Myxococcota bacterium]
MNNPWLDFDKKWNVPPMEDNVRPVFVLASIWRSGSTLVQRLISSDPSILLWGEPYGDAGFLPSLANSSKALLRSDWPHPMMMLDKKADTEGYEEIRTEPHSFWIANLYPKPEVLRNSFRTMLDQLFHEPVLALGRERFGIKEIRYDGVTAFFLQWLYPNARFIFLHRNPYDAWSSYKGARWCYQWPKVIVEDVRLFAKLWRRNFESFLPMQSHPNTINILFEDLVRNPENMIPLLEEHCDVRIKREVMTQKIRGVDKKKMWVSEKEQEIIHQICGDIAEPLGYLGPRNTVSQSG